MFFKCRYFGNTLLTITKQINNQLPKAVISHTIIQQRCCSANKDSNLNTLNYDLITNGDKELEHKLKILEMELEVMRQEGLLVPENSFISTERWQELLTLKSRSARLRLYTFLFKIMKKKENVKIKKLEKAKKYEESLLTKEKEPDNLPLEGFAQKYNLGYNNILLRVYETTMNELYNNRLIQAIRFGEKLVIDCGYENEMTKRENVNCAKQIMLLFADNRFNDDPFDIHLCNVNKKGEIMLALHKLIPTMYEKWFPLNIHENSYLDIFHQDELVYLTPHCQNEITQFDPNVVYVLGGIVDKSNNEPFSLAKAKKENLKMQKLPLDKYLQWGSGGGKNLTVNQMTSILLDLKNTGDWEQALKHVPRRKIVSTDIKGNILNASNALRYDRPEKWSPKGVDFSQLKYGNKQRSVTKKPRKDRLIALRNIINE